MYFQNQIYTIESYDRKEIRCFDIKKVVEKHYHTFKAEFGTSFNFVPVKQEWSSYSRRPTTIDDNKYEVFIKFETTSFNVITSCTRKFIVDCLYIIRDGFGRAIHPDAILRAYHEEYGIKKIKFSDKLYLTRYGFYVSNCSVYDQGHKKGSYGHNTQYKYKQTLSDIAFAKLNLNAVHDELVENEWDLVQVPAIRCARADAVYHGKYWETPYRNCQKSWKWQTKNSKSWGNRIK